MNIEVKRKHIKQGEIGDHNACAVALAVRDALKLDKTASVSVSGGSRFYVTANGGHTAYVCPRSVQRFIKRFDSSDEANNKLKKPAPFAFRLRKAA